MPFSRIMLLPLLLLLSCSEPLRSDLPPVSPAPVMADTGTIVPDSLVKTDSVIPAATVAAPEPPPQNAANLNREDLINFARQYLGTPYVYAAADPEKGFDCSGFINYVYHHYNIPVPRSSIDFKDYGREIPLEKASIGDLILFTSPTDSTRIGHIGIICKADNKNTEFIHASSGEAMAVTISSMASAHYTKRFVKVIDVISK